MKRIGSFAAGFAAGWIMRSTVHSSHEAVVKLVSLGYDAVARARRIFALERERLDDLVAEARERTQKERMPNQQDGSSPPRQREQREQRS